MSRPAGTAMLKKLILAAAMLAVVLWLVWLLRTLGPQMI